MDTWAELAGLKGIYTSQEIPYSLTGDGAITKVTWVATNQSDTTVTLETALSFNGGATWTDWMVCNNGGSIPQIKSTTSLESAKLKFRVIMETSSSTSSPQFSSISFDLTPVIVFNNKGNAKCKPEIWVTKHGNGDFSIINTSQNNETFSFKNLVDRETIYVNNERQDIQTSLAVTYRYSDFNDNYLEFPTGMNVLKVIGDATIRFRYQFPF